MKVQLTLNIGGQEDTLQPLRACDACYLDFETIQKHGLTPCPCPATPCPLDWCRGAAGDHHQAYRLHLIGLIPASDLLQHPMPEYARKLLAAEKKAYRSTLEMALQSVDLYGQKLCQTEAQWKHIWYRNQAPSWAYLNAPSGQG